MSDSFSDATRTSDTVPPPAAPPPAHSDHADPDTDTDTDDSSALDLDAVERDLDGVQAALERLADGTYWTDEVTGDPIAADILDADPTARRN